jgi:sec-independent protein translocase protein TatA
MTLLFLNLGGGEVVLILLVVVMFFGSKSIPDLARGLGRGLREIKDATENIKREIEDGASISKNESTKAQSKEVEQEKDFVQSTVDTIRKPLDQPAE